MSKNKTNLVLLYFYLFIITTTSHSPFPPHQSPPLAHSRPNFSNVVQSCSNNCPSYPNTTIPNFSNFVQSISNYCPSFPPTPPMQYAVTPRYAKRTIPAYENATFARRPDGYSVTQKKQRTPRRKRTTGRTTQSNNDEPINAKLQRAKALTSTQTHGMTNHG